MKKHYDLIITGAGIIGLASALAARRKGLSVAVIEQNSRCIGASVRNFGFVTVTGQRAGKHWQRARRSRDVWAEVAPQAGIKVIHQGTLIPAYRPEAAAVCEAFLRTEMGEVCSLINESKAQKLAPAIRSGAKAYLYSPHELRVESATATPKLAQWLEQEQGVDFYWSTRVLSHDLPHIETTRGNFTAEHFIACPGHDFSLLPTAIRQQAGIQVCTLQMLRVDPGIMKSSNVAVMSDLSLARYEGFAALPEAKALQQRLDEELPAQREAGIHLIVVRSADGSLVVGDSHVYGEAEQVFASEAVDELIMQVFDQTFALPGRKITGRWLGSYAAAENVVFSWQPRRHSVLAMVTGGTGASTGFAFGEELVEQVLR